MEITPKVSMCVNIAVLVCSALAAAGSEFTQIFGAGTANKVVAGISLMGLVLGTINTALHGLSSPQSGPMLTGKGN